jgi:hypothetical protein
LRRGRGAQRGNSQQHSGGRQQQISHENSLALHIATSNGARLSSTLRQLVFL